MSRSAPALGLLTIALLLPACGPGKTTSAIPAAPNPTVSNPAVNTTRSGASLPASEQPWAASVPVAPTAVAQAASPGFGASTATIRITTLADVGLEANSLDRSVDPCVDFFEFACGGWVANNPIPADKSSWSRFSEVDQRNENALRSIVEKAVVTSQTRGSAGTSKVKISAMDQAIGSYFGSCMNQPLIEKKSMASFTPLLAKTTAVKNAKTWFAALTELHKAGIWVVWSASVDADLKASTKNIMYLDSAGLGLPDRDYYFDDNFKAKVESYREHVQRMLALTGLTADQAKAGATNVVALETALAKITKTGVARRDVPAMYNPLDRKTLASTITSVDWKAYFKALGVEPGPTVVLTSPVFFAALDGLRKTFPPAAWASYFSYHLLNQAAFALPQRFDDEAFALAQTLSGVKTQRERYKRCIDSTQGALDQLVGQAFVDHYFAGTSKARAAEMIDAIVDVMGEKIGQLDWMTVPTKAIAQAKLKKVARMIGYPDKWRTYNFTIKPDDFFGNRVRAAQAETKRQLSRAGKPVDRNDWLMGAYEVNAYYNPSANNTALPAGILQPPFFGQDRSVAANLGGISMVIGHELTHGFDDQGSQFDADGNLQNWWSAADLKNFTDKGTCVADQYASFEVLPKQFINGRLTLGENIADLGGVKMAYGALQKLRGKASEVIVADGFTEPQQFFLGVGQAWCSSSRTADAERRLKTDVHSPPKHRIYGALRNLPEFARAFSCAPGTPMNPAKICSIW